LRGNLRDLLLALGEVEAQRFPVEPVRSLDAVHLASAIEPLGLEEA
jgi:hypothetical protein